MSSMLKIINRNNKKIVKTSSPQANEPANQCSCRLPLECSLDYKCLSNNIVYQCTVHHNDTTQSYIEITATTFKSKYNAHKSSFKDKHLEHSTSLSKYLWDLKAKNTNFGLKWRILTSASAYCNTTKRCNLCIQEKIYILYKPLLAPLNNCSELLSRCRHISNTF